MGCLVLHDIYSFIYVSVTNATFTQDVSYENWISYSWIGNSNLNVKVSCLNGGINMVSFSFHYKCNYSIVTVIHSRKDCRTRIDSIIINMERKNKFLFRKGKSKVQIYLEIMRQVFYRQWLKLQADHKPAEIPYVVKPEIHKGLHKAEQNMWPSHT